MQKCGNDGPVKKVGGMPPEALGPWMYNLLDGHAALALESIDMKDMCTEGGEELVFRELDQRCPVKVAVDRMGEAMEEALELGEKIMKNEPVFSRKVRTCRRKPEGTKSCVDVDL